MKILMALMGLEIGGAETHVVELSKALKNKGHDITVASNGGVYQSELEAYGIKHVKVPLHSKKPWLFIKSYLRLKKLFDTEDYDIVHAHARIPAYICGLLAKKYSFRFVTTAHWVFKITPLWKKLANWGEKTIAVSDDIKDYLIENYSVWSDNISTTINGIDTHKFSKNTDWSDIKEEFALEDNKYRILYVSRMDEDRSAVAYMVAEAMPEILRIRPNAELIIVGDGNDFSRLKAHTDEINKKIGHNAIILTGARVDINKFVASADVFVGVSRSALEAMAVGIPVIIAGNEGYIGIFDETKYQISYDTNYCCRGCEASTTEIVQRDLLKLATMNKDELEKIADYNKKVIYEQYSADRMAQDYQDMYNSFSPVRHSQASSIIINGYYGYKNTGDDALLQAMLDSIKKENPDAHITVLSSSPKETTSRYSVNSINRYNLIKVVKAMKKAKLFISGGGSLLQDVTSTKSLVYYTEMIKLAKRSGLKIMIYANGFGPINKQNNLARVKKALSSADYISVREPASRAAILSLLPELDIKISADPAFSLTKANEKWSNKLCEKLGFTDDKKYFAVSVRDWQYNDSKIVSTLANYCRSVHDQYGFIPVFITMQSSKDLSIIDKIKENLNCEALTINRITAKELLSVMERMEFAVGMRLHFLVFSIIATTPSIGLSYDPKINALLEYIGLSNPLDTSNLSLETLIEKTRELIENSEEISTQLKLISSRMSEMNKLDAKIVKELIS